MHYGSVSINAICTQARFFRVRSPAAWAPVSRELGPTHAELVRLGVERDIFKGALLPGTPLEEGRLAVQYGVSRTPVREAIANLAQAGLVTKNARRRAVVSALDPVSLLEMFEALAELEALAARLATERMPAVEKQALVTLHEEAGALLDSGGYENSYAELGSQFHQAVLKGCRNTVLIDTTSSLAQRVLPFRRYQLVAPGRLRRNQADHEEILSAILSSDGLAAADAMLRHTSGQGDALMRFIALHKVPYSDLGPRELQSIAEAK